MTSSQPTREPYHYGWVCCLCSNCNYCNYTNLCNMQQTTKCKGQHNESACPHVHIPTPSDQPPPYSISCSSCEMVVYLMPGNLEGIISVPHQLDVLDGKIAEKEKGWGCLDCHTMWEYEKHCDRTEVKVCKKCGQRSKEQWMRVLVISDEDVRGYFTDAED
jgi:hypothetical protein